MSVWSGDAGVAEAQKRLHFIDCKKDIWMVYTYEGSNIGALLKILWRSKVQQLWSS